MCGFGPDEGAGSVVPAVDEGPDLGGQVLYRGEGSPVDGLLLDDGEPDLDQVQPRTGRRREVEMDTWIRGKPVADFDRLVGCVVIHDQMQFLVGVGLRNVFEEPQKLLAAVPRLGDSGDLAGGDLQRCEQRRRAVTDVIMGATLGKARFHR